MTTLLGLSEDQITRMRENVLERVTPSKRVRVPRRRIAIGLSGALVIAAAATIIAIVPSISPMGTSSAAAAALHSAALATIESSDPVVQPGQYLRVDTNSVYIAYGHSESGQSETWLNPTSGVLYIPSDPRGTWVWERHNLQPTTFFGKGTDAGMDYFNNKNPNLNGVFRAKNGDFYGGRAENYHFDSLPRDPAKLRDYFYNAYAGGSSSVDEDVWVRMTDMLRSGTVPADLRASMYRTIALIPGVTLVDSEATLDGKSGIAIGRSEAGRNSRVDIIIDPTTGLLIGEREVALAEQGDIPANTVIGWSAVTTIVVDITP